MKAIQHVAVECLGSTMMVYVVGLMATAACAIDRLKMSLHTCTNCPQHALDTCLGLPSGQAALHACLGASVRLDCGQ